MKFKFTISIYFLLAILSFSAKGQGFLQTKGKAIVNENGDSILLRGMGMGGWMIQEGYMLQTADFANAQNKIREKIEQLIGVADTELFYEAWLDNHVRKIDIDSLKSWGFNSIRLPMHYNLFTLPIEKESVAGQNTWLDKGFELTDSLISWCRQNEMYVILDLHAAPGGQGQDQGISDYDPTKPSLWESIENRNKTTALWKRIAERYADETWVAGYDLLNETNWNLPGGVALRNLYGEITNAIRTVDKNHILFIEGNWFANDFTGLTPPWDDNLVYSPHKYWSINDQASIQWVLNIRDQYEVPIYFGEAGENSNTWFRDAIKLMEDNNIGWAWWPMKKIESIAGPLSVKKTPAYQSLLNYWSGVGNAPSVQFAKDALMELTELIKMENCVYQKDVIDAMFRQVYSDEAIPFRTQSIPGIVYATDFDMGIIGSAYFDSEVANYHVSTGNYTAWNNGWTYRNDGVDIEKNNDNFNTNGFNVGWLSEGEWMQYDIDVANDAVYDIKVRIASAAANGQFHFGSGDAAISNKVETWNTGGWQNWHTFIVPDVILTTEDKKLRFYVDAAEFNLSSFEFVEKAPTNSLVTDFFYAQTLDLNTIKLVLNKPLSAPVSNSINDFEIIVDGNIVPIENVELSPVNSRVIYLDVDHVFKSNEIIKISYTGNQISALDDTTLNIFSLKDVENTVPNIHPIPGKIEAEEYFNQQGVVLETTTDVGGGQNVGFLDPGDYMDYLVNVAQGGVYEVKYRNASDGGEGGIKLQLIDDNGLATDLHEVGFTSTGGWQTWQATTATVTLMSGIQQLRVEITQSPFNLNWFEFNLLTPTDEENSLTHLNVFPNPSADRFLVQTEFFNRQNIELQIFNNLGQVVFSKKINNVLFFNKKLDLSHFSDGHYYINIKTESGRTVSKKIVKIGN